MTCSETIPSTFSFRHFFRAHAGWHCQDACSPPSPAGHAPGGSATGITAASQCPGPVWRCTGPGRLRWLPHALLPGWQPGDGPEVPPISLVGMLQDCCIDVPDVHVPCSRLAGSSTKHSLDLRVISMQRVLPVIMPDLHKMRLECMQICLCLLLCFSSLCSE